MTSRGNITNDIDHPNGYIAVTSSRKIIYTLIINDENGLEEERSDIFITVE